MPKRQGVAHLLETTFCEESPGWLSMTAPDAEVYVSAPQGNSSKACMSLICQVYLLMTSLLTSKSRLAWLCCSVLSKAKGANHQYPLRRYMPAYHIGEAY